jgi:hypothetical protein
MREILAAAVKKAVKSLRRRRSPQLRRPIPPQRLAAVEVMAAGVVEFFPLSS